MLRPKEKTDSTGNIWTDILENNDMGQFKERRNLLELQRMDTLITLPQWASFFWERKTTWQVSSSPTKLCSANDYSWAGWFRLSPWTSSPVPGRMGGRSTATPVFFLGYAWLPSSIVEDLKILRNKFSCLCWLCLLSSHGTTNKKHPMVKFTSVPVWMIIRDNVSSIWSTQGS